MCLNVRHNEDEGFSIQECIKASIVSEFFAAVHAVVSTGNPESLVCFTRKLVTALEACKDIPLDTFSTDLDSFCDDVVSVRIVAETWPVMDSLWAPVELPTHVTLVSAVIVFLAMAQQRVTSSTNR